MISVARTTVRPASDGRTCPTRSRTTRVLSGVWKTTRLKWHSQANSKNVSQYLILGDMEFGFSNLRQTCVDTPIDREKSLKNGSDLSDPGSEGPRVWGLATLIMIRSSQLPYMHIVVLARRSSTACMDLQGQISIISGTNAYCCIPRKMM